MYEQIFKFELYKIGYYRLNKQSDELEYLNFFTCGGSPKDFKEAKAVFENLATNKTYEKESDGYRPVKQVLVRVGKGQTVIVKQYLIDSQTHKCSMDDRRWERQLKLFSGN